MGRKVGGSFERVLMRERTCVSLWLIHVDVWQKPSLYCKVIILQLKIKLKRRGRMEKTKLKERKISFNKNGLLKNSYFYA